MGQDIRQTEHYGEYLQRLGWKVIKLKGCQVYIKSLPFIGSIIKILRPDEISFFELNELAKEVRPLFVKIETGLSLEPKILIEQGFTLDKSPLLPTKTLCLDLTLPETVILSQMKKDARQAIKRGQLKNFKVLTLQYPSTLISTFISLWHRNARERGFWIPISHQIQALWKAFCKKTYLLMVFPPNDLGNLNNPLAGILLILHGKTSYYFYAASTPKGRKISTSYSLVWEAIKLSKNLGCSNFDFEGIYDERFPQKSWKGFTHFKKSFGGREVIYKGSFIKFYNPILKFIYNLCQLFPCSLF